MRLAGVLIAAALLGGCGGAAPEGGGEAAKPQDLESAAIERGVVRDPRNSEITGLYARDTDRVCIVKQGLGYRIGAFVDYGDGIACSGSGKVSRVGETLHLELGADGACSFDARYDGERILFPGQVPEGCQALCDRRASFAAMEVTRLSESAAEAQALRDPKGKRLCSE